MKSSPESPILLPIDIDVTTYTEVTRERDQDSEWDNDDTRESHTINGIKISDGDYGDLTVGYPVWPGQDYHLVFVIYDTGDSFGRYAGKIAFIDLYATYEKAKETAERIEKDVNSKEYELSVYTETGKKLKVYKPWEGYFERFSGVYIETVQLLGENEQSDNRFKYNK